MKEDNENKTRIVIRPSLTVLIFISMIVIVAVGIILLFIPNDKYKEIFLSNFFYPLVLISIASLFGALFYEKFKGI